MLCAASAVLLSGCAKTVLPTDPPVMVNAESPTDPVKTATESDVLPTDESETVYQACIDALKTDGADIESVFLENFPMIGEEAHTTLVDLWIYGVYNAAQQCAMSDTEKNLLMRSVRSDKTFDPKLIDDEETEKKVSDFGAQHIVPRFVNGELFYDVDYGYFEKTFKGLLRKDYEAMLSFFEKEKTVDYCDEGRVALYTDVVIDRLNEIEKIRKEFPDSEIMDLIEESRNFYRCVYLGAYSQDYVFENGSIRENVLNSYENDADTISDKELSDFVKEIAVEYRKVNGTKTVPITEKIKGFCGIVPADAAD